MVDSELAIVDELASADATLDPPGALWRDIEHALAEAEVGDAGRSRLSLWWESVRPHAPLVAIGAVTTVALVLWMRGPEPQEPVRATVDPPARQAPVTDYNATFAASASPTEAPATHQEVIALEIGRADKRYLQAIAELRAIANDEREGWSAADIKAFDQKLQALDAKARDQRKRLALVDQLDPSQRDALYAVYREQLDFLQRATFGSDSADEVTQ
jgi:hypothetical protein